MKRSKWTTEAAIVAVALLIVVVASACNSGYKIGTAAKVVESNWEYLTIRSPKAEMTVMTDEMTILDSGITEEAEPETDNTAYEPINAPENTAEVERPEDIPAEIDALKMANMALYEAEPEWQYDEADDDVLVRIAMAEAGGEGVIGKALVMRVVLNRVESERFPNTVSGVVFQKLGDVYQFSPVSGYGVINGLHPDEECYEALELVKGGWDESAGATFFEAAPPTASTWHSRNLKYLFRYGGHSFYDLP